MLGLPDGEKNFEDMHNRLDRIPACDRQTDGQTSCHSIVRAMHMRRAVKKNLGGKYVSCINKGWSTCISVVMIPAAVASMSCHATDHRSASTQPYIELPFSITAGSPSPHYHFPTAILPLSYKLSNNMALLRYTRTTRM